MRKVLVFLLVLAVGVVFAEDKKRTYKVTGYVGKSSSQVASGVSVILIHKDSEEVVGTASTNFMGKYTIKNVPPGVYVLQVENIKRTLGVKNKNVRLDIDLSAEAGIMDYAKTGAAMINKENEAKKNPGGSAGTQPQAGSSTGAPAPSSGSGNPETTQLMQSMAGEYYSYSGSTERKLMLCPGGAFFDSSESSYSGSGYDSLGNQNMAWGSASANQGSGKWVVAGNIQNGMVFLNYKSGKRVNVQYTKDPDKRCYQFSGVPYCYAGPPRCQ